MIKVSVVNNVDGRTFASQLADQAAADMWIGIEVALNDWGKPDRWINSNDPALQSEDMSRSDQNRQGTDGQGNDITQYHFPVEYTITQTDVTAQVAQQTLLSRGLQAQAVGATAVAQVYALNEAKFTAGTLTTQDFQVILADATLQMIERLLWNGSLATAKAMIQAYNSPYFTADDIASVVAIIDNSGLL